MVRVLEGRVSRRLLITFRVDPEVAAAIVPAPLVPRDRQGRAIAAVSLVRLEELRPRGLKPLPGLALENMAHYLAVTAPGERGPVNGVYVLRRHTESRLVALLASPPFRGEHRRARFDIEEDERQLRVAVSTDDGSCDLAAEVDWPAAFMPTPSFPAQADAERFLGECERGFSAGRAERVLETVELKPVPGRLEPVRLREVRARFFEDEKAFPEGSVELDAGFALRNDPLAWVAVRDLPEVLEEPLLPLPA